MARTERLGDHVDIVTGFPFKSGEYVEDGIRLLRGDNIGQGRLRWAGAKKWPESRMRESARFLLESGDVVLAMDRPWIEAGLKCASVTQSDLPCLLVQRVARLRTRGELTQPFLRYLIGSRPFIDYIRGVQTGTGIPHISAGQISDFRFEWIPRGGQRAIAEVLWSLDDKIELNEKICATSLELGDSFYEFCAERDHPVGRATFGQLMGDGFLQFGDGYRTKKAEHGTPGLPILRVSDVGEGAISSSFGDHVREEFRPAMARKTSRPGDVVLTTKGTVGRVAKISPHDAEFVYSPQVCFFRTAGASPVSASYLLHWLRGQEFWRQAAGMKGQTDMADYLSLSDIRALKISLPTEPALAEFDRRCAPLHDRAEAARSENRTLAELRDTLLPQLVTGKLRVKDAVRAVEETV